MASEELYMPEQDLRKMQMIQLEMLLEVDRICKKHRIKYCIIAGTLLGAVRHRGYIPWDDDADIAMLRDEYERFCKICETELDIERFYLQHHENTEGYRWGYGKIRRKGTEFIRYGQEHMPYPSGVFIDVFPLDDLPNNTYLRRIHDLGCTIVRKLLWSEVGAICEEKKSIRMIYSVLRKIPTKTIFKMHKMLIKMGKVKNSKWVRTITFPTANNLCGYKKKWYEELSEISFEGYNFSSIKNHDEYLSFKFGNYHELPPIEQRKVHKASFYSLDVEPQINRQET